MSRKLRNSLNALVVTAAICATGAFATASMPFAHTAAAASTTVDAPAATHASTGHRKVGRLNRIRHSLAMPYFSFVPRG